VWLHRLAVRQERRQRASTAVRRRQHPPPGLAVLKGVPGISDATARALLERFGSIEGLLAAGPDQWAEVNGVGQVRAHALVASLLGHKKGHARAA
jgi:excinuclease ABC subunit C